MSRPEAGTDGSSNVKRGRDTAVTVYLAWVSYGMPVPSGSHWGDSPRESVQREVERRGEPAVISGCAALLRGEEVDGQLIFALGGPPARWAVEGGQSGPEYWLRVWAARGLLYAYDPIVDPEVLRALDDENWRVREMAAKVCARHRIEAALPVLSKLTHDTRPRVQRSAARAVAKITA